MPDRNRPNILLIMTDQHAPRIAGFAGDQVVDTSHLDALATRSVQFDTAICASPVCTPSRMCMLTGKDIHHCSAWNNHWIIFPEHVTWPEHFAAHGYTTCLVGKMHFGGKDQMQGFQHRPYGDLRHGLGHQPDPIDLFPAYHGPTMVGETHIPESLLQEMSSPGKRYPSYWNITIGSRKSPGSCAPHTADLILHIPPPDDISVGIGTRCLP